MSKITVRQAGYAAPRDAAAIVGLLDTYALDPMGGGTGLSAEARLGVVAGLRACPSAFSVLAWTGDEAVGLLNCFGGFSTFQCKPLINIHDVVVTPAWRGRGVAKRMFDFLEELARERGCCKLTLEVLEGNAPAQALYRKCGFGAYALDPAMGRALFWEKKLGA